MLQTLKLVLPIFIPSWQFFKEISPSPRIEFNLRKEIDVDASVWQELTLIPKGLSAISMLRSLFYNAERNELFFMMNCAEQLIANPREYYSQEIMQRIKARLERNGVEFKATPYLQFRLVFVHRPNIELEKEILYVSEITRVYGETE